MKNAKKPGDYHKECLALLESGISTKERFREAVVRLFELRRLAKGVRAFSALLEETASKMGDAAAASGADHVTAFDAEAMTETKGGIMSGVVGIDGNLYRLTISKDRPERIDGGNLTQDFLARLPAAWTTSRLALATSQMQDVLEDTLAECGLTRAIRRVWSRCDNPQADPDAAP